MESLFRQIAVEELPTSPPRDILNRGRTKTEKASSGTQKSLAYLAQMIERETASFTSNEKYLLKKAHLVYLLTDRKQWDLLPMRTGESKRVDC